MSTNPIRRDHYPTLTLRSSLIGSRLDSACSHEGLVQTVALAEARGSPDPAAVHKGQVTCPLCQQVLELRLWQPLAGGRYLTVRERFVAGRTWIFREEGRNWVLGSYRSGHEVHG